MPDEFPRPVVARPDGVMVSMVTGTTFRSNLPSVPSPSARAADNASFPWSRPADHRDYQAPPGVNSRAHSRDTRARSGTQIQRAKVLIGRTSYCPVPRPTLQVRGRRWRSTNSIRHVLPFGAGRIPLHQPVDQSPRGDRMPSFAHAQLLQAGPHPDRSRGQARAIRCPMIATFSAHILDLIVVAARAGVCNLRQPAFEGFLSSRSAASSRCS